ncbi:MAG: DNA polymerase/3'-5' exonuclease PolX [Pseudomonadota bacterium]|nr:DNA polymerase/3'-5' exonuclease PolX [Pseudomonadota bacterium]
MDNADIAKVFFELADLMEFHQVVDFKVRAFRSAAQIIENLPEPCTDMLREGTLAEVPRIGEGIVRRVAELCRTGTLAELEELRKRAPAGLAEILRIDGMGPRSTELVWHELGITTVDELEAAAKAQRLRGLPRFGAKKEEKLLAAIAAHRRASGRYKLTQAYPHAEALVRQLRKLPEVLRIEACGTIRRRRDTVGDIDLLVATRQEHAVAVAERFVHLPEVRDVVAHGETKCTVHLKDGIQVDLRIVPPESWGAALHYFTGSKEHNIAIRGLAVRRGLKINEYGIFGEDDQRLGGEEEREIFAAVGLPYIEPELRENRGEIEAAAEGRLPHLVEERDIRGDLHMHTNETDGQATLEAMVAEARRLGREYVAITDHSQALSMALGLDPTRLRAQGRQIDALNDKLGGRPHVLRGIEADILADGSVDLGPEVLRELDWVVASVHSMFGLPRAEQTRRIVRALESGVVDCLGHPTGRLIGQREPYAVDLEAVLDAARRVGAAVELNAFPDRLDLWDVHLRMAQQMGVPVVISTDSHAPFHMLHMRYGVWTARRGWLEPKDVANTLPLRELRARFAHHHRQLAHA